MGYHMTLNTLFKAFNIGNENSNNTIDRIDVTRDGWTKYWRPNEVPDMLAETGEMNVLSIEVWYDYDESATVLGITAS